ncbi:phage virion morphogenesis protein [Vibrio cholerae]
MAGVTLSINVSDVEAIRSHINQFAERGQNMSPALRDIGEHLLLSHHERWQQQQSPDGTPWAPLSPKYQKRKKKHADLILVLNQHLSSSSLNYDVDPLGLSFGTSSEYGAIHHFGGSPEMRPSNAAIPARPWLGLSESDFDEIAQILAIHLTS